MPAPFRPQHGLHLLPMTAKVPRLLSEAFRSHVVVVATFLNRVNGRHQ